MLSNSAHRKSFKTGIKTKLVFNWLAFFLASAMWGMNRLPFIAYWNERECFMGTELSSFEFFFVEQPFFCSSKTSDMVPFLCTNSYSIILITNKRSCVPFFKAPFFPICILMSFLPEILHQIRGWKDQRIVWKLLPIYQWLYFMQQHSPFCFHCNVYGKYICWLEANCLGTHQQQLRCPIYVLTFISNFRIQHCFANKFVVTIFRQHSRNFIICNDTICSFIN